MPPTLEVTREREWVRSLARQVIALAHEPRMADIRRRWRRVNALQPADRAPVFAYNREKTLRRLEQTREALGDIAPVRITADVPLSATLCAPVAALRGLNGLLLDLALNPALVHRLMVFARDAVLQAMDAAEAAGVLTPNTSGPMTCSAPIGHPRPDGTFTCANLWCMANSQEFDPVSPAMWEEFLLAYQLPIFARFGRVGYGCCEDLTHKLAGVLSIPNLRLVVCSAWTDLDRVIEAVAGRHTIMWRQKASEVVFAEDLAGVRRHLLDGCRRLRGCSYQIVLRELQTLAGHPDRLREWTAAAKDAAERRA